MTILRSVRSASPSSFSALCAASKTTSSRFALGRPGGRRASMSLRMTAGGGGTVDEKMEVQTADLEADETVAERRWPMRKESAVGAAGEWRSVGRCATQSLSMS